MCESTILFLSLTFSREGRDLLVVSNLLRQSVQYTDFIGKSLLSSHAKPTSFAGSLIIEMGNNWLIFVLLYGSVFRTKSFSTFIETQCSSPPCLGISLLWMVACFFLLSWLWFQFQFVSSNNLTHFLMKTTWTFQENGVWYYFTFVKLWYISPKDCQWQLKMISINHITFQVFEEFTSYAVW